MTNSEPTDAELIAAIRRSVERGDMIEVTDAWLAARQAELNEED